MRYEHVLQGLIRWGLVLSMKNIRFKYQSRDITRYTVAHLYATQTLQRVFRRRRALKKVEAALATARKQNLLSSKEGNPNPNDKKHKKSKKHKKHKSNETPEEKQKRKAQEAERRAKERNEAIASLTTVPRAAPAGGEGGDTEPIESPKRYVRRPV